MLFVYIILLSACLFAVILVLQNRKISMARHKGIYPQKGKATKADIKRLLKAGERVLAIRVYRELHGGSLKAAKKVIDSFES